jgi:hypothetical protein
MKTLTLVYSSFPLILFANRPSEGRGPAGDFLLESKDLQIHSPCRFGLGIEEEEGSPRLNLARVSPFPSGRRPPRRPRPPIPRRRPADAPTRPRLAETEHIHPTPPLGHAITTEGTRSELHTTDRLPTHRLATDLAQAPLSNSPNQMPAIPAVHVAMTSPNRRRRAAQRAQSVLHVPVHLHAA